MDSVYTELKSQDGQSVITLEVLGYQYPDVLSGWDADWYVVHLAVKLPSFSYHLTTAALCGGELEDFCRELQEFSAIKSNDVTLEPMEPYIDLALTFDSKKNVDVSGTVLEANSDSRGELQFEFKTDLPNVDFFIQGIQMVLKRFPPRRVV